MKVNDSSVRTEISIGTVMQGGRWVAFSGFAYVIAWIIGLIIGQVTSAPGPTDPASTIGAYFSSHREAAMIQAYFLDGIAGISLIVFAAALRSALRPFEGERAILSSVLFGSGVAAARYPSCKDFSHKSLQTASRSSGILPRFARSST